MRAAGTGAADRARDEEGRRHGLVHSPVDSPVFVVVVAAAAVVAGCAVSVVVVFFAVFRNCRVAGCAAFLATFFFACAYKWVCPVVWSLPQRKTRLLYIKEHETARVCTYSSSAGARARRSGLEKAWSLTDAVKCAVLSSMHASTHPLGRVQLQTFGQFGDDDAGILGDIAVLLIRRSEVHRPQGRVLRCTIATDHGVKPKRAITTPRATAAAAAADMRRCREERAKEKNIGRSVRILTNIPIGLRLRRTLRVRAALDGTYGITLTKYLNKIKESCKPSAFVQLAPAESAHRHRQRNPITQESSDR